MAKKPENPDQPEEDRVELESLFKRYYPKVVYFFMSFGLDKEEARDLAQETFLRAHRGSDSFRGDARESTWLFEIARNIFKNQLRDNATLKKRRIEVSLSQSSSQDDSATDPALEVEDPRPLPDKIALDHERAARLARAVESLSPQQRQCVELRLADLKYHEIAAIMLISIETVKSHLHQARHALRPALRDLD